MTDWEQFIPPGETNDSFPGWQWIEFAHWAEQNLASYVPVPGGLLQTRGEFAVKAWQHPLSVDGVIAKGFLRAWRTLDPDAYLMASSTWNDTVAQLDRPLLTEHLESTGMSALIVPDAFLVAVNGLAGGQVVTNVIGVKNAGGTALGAANAVKTAFTHASGPLAQKSSFFAYTDVHAMDISSADGAIAEVAATNTGALAGASHATNAASALVKWNGGTRSASSRGRMYFGPLNEGQINSDGRTLTTAAATAIKACMDFVVSNLSTAGYPLCVISRKNSSATVVSSVQVETVIASQRRRIR